MKSNWFKYFFVTLLVCAATANAFSQSLRVTHYNKEEGLPTELTKSISQDTLGFIWIASDEGLIKFNGFKFELFKEELPNQYVKDVVTTKEGRILALTDNGLIEVHSHPDKVVFRPLVQSRTLAQDSIMWFPKQLFCDVTGTVWVADQSHVYQVKQDTVKAYKLPFKAYSNDWQRASTFVEGGDGILYVISQTGYWFYYDAAKDELVEMEIPAFFHEVHCAISLDSNRLMVSANSNIYVVEVENRKVKSHKHIQNMSAAYILKGREGFYYIGTWLRGMYTMTVNGDEIQFKKIHDYKYNSANHVWQAKDGSVWATSDNGVCLLQKKSFETPLAHVTQTYIQSIFPDNAGRMYISEGNHVFRAEHKADEFEIETVLRNSNKIYLQAIPADNGLWVSDTDGFVTFIAKNGEQTLYDLSDKGGSVFYMHLDASGTIWACQDRNPNLLRLADGEYHEYGPEKGILTRPIVVRESPSNELYVGASSDEAYLYKYSYHRDRFVNQSKALNFSHSDQILVNDIAFDKKNNLWIASSFGLLKLQNDTVFLTDLGATTHESVKSIAFDANNTLWLSNSNGLIKLQDGNQIVFDESEGLPSKTLAYRSLRIDKKGALWVGTVAGLGYAQQVNESKLTPKPFFINITNEKGEVDIETQHVFNSDDFLKFQFVVPIFPSKSVRYEWRRRGKTETHWKRVDFNKEILLAKSKTGKHIFEVRAKQNGNFIWSEPLQFHFRINLVWYKRWWVWLAIGTILSLLVLVVIRSYTWSLNRRNQYLEEQVATRTQAIQESEKQLRSANQHLAMQTQALDLSAVVSIADRKGIITYVNNKFCELSKYSSKELLGQNHRIVRSDYHDDEFFKQMWSTIAVKKGIWRGEICNKAKDGSHYWVDATVVPFLDEKRRPYQYLAIRFDITEKKRAEQQLLEHQQEIEHQNKHITSSMSYASRIQNAVLKTGNLLDNAFSDNFVLFRPKEVVSGDFYWAKKVDGATIIVAADCTGHGVPGAFMSMLGISSLNEIVMKKNVTQPSDILEELRSQIKASLQQKGEAKEAKDGMDMSLCLIDDQKKTLKFAGANNPVYIVRNSEFYDLAPTKNPVGIYHREKPFITHTFALEPGDIIYQFTDGYADQFGGENGDKFKRHRFKSLLLEVADMPLSLQRNILENSFDGWRGDLPQIDDVLVVALKI